MGKKTTRTLTITYTVTHEREIDVDDFSLSDEELAEIEQKELGSLGLTYDQMADAEISWDKAPIAKIPPYEPPTEDKWFIFEGSRWATNGRFLMRENCPVVLPYVEWFKIRRENELQAKHYIHQSYRLSKISANIPKGHFNNFFLPFKHLPNAEFLSIGISMLEPAYVCIDRVCVAIIQPTPPKNMPWDSELPPDHFRFHKD
jgi:hypothetical protein